jgi:beta-N-acetylhexosaminidase
MSSIFRAAGRMVVGGFAGPEPDEAFLAALEAGDLGGVIFFAENYRSPVQLAALVASLQARAPWPLFFAVDQEGGKVQRFRAPFTEIPEMAEVGARGDPDLAFRVGRVLGAELAAVGVCWDFAPVLDVDTNPENPVIGRRAFGRDAAQVAALGVALARGLEAAGVLSCGKHYPGHGDTAKDSHLTLPVLPHDLDRLRQVELVPFAAYARAGLASVMTAHVLFTAVDPERPATLSLPALSILRDELRFGGLIVSDDLEMKAVADRYEVEELVESGVAAGIDVFLVCHDLGKARRASAALRRLAGGPAGAAIASSLARIEATAARFRLPRRPLPPREISEILGCEAHRRVAREIKG